MSGIRGDFTGFTFGNKHSSELGITRVSNGSRYDENLLPTMQDKTVQVPGGDGTYYFGSFYTQKPFNIPIAFDSLTEEEVRTLREHFGNKNPQRLIFDEAPYKYYMAKVTGTPQIKTICFDEDGRRIYKGEGTISFTCYYPYAKSNFKFLDDFKTLQIKIKENNEDKTYTYLEFYNNLNEWKDTSRMLDNQGNYNKIPSASISLYNAGDMETDFKIYLKFHLDPSDVEGLTKLPLAINELNLKQNEKLLNSLIFSSSIIAKNKEDEGICINSKNNLIEGFKENKENQSYELTGTIYNEYISSGDFFKIPLGYSDITSEAEINKIEYDYIYY